MKLMIEAPKHKPNTPPTEATKNKIQHLIHMLLNINCFTHMKKFTEEMIPTHVDGMFICNASNVFESNNHCGYIQKVIC